MRELKPDDVQFQNYFRMNKAQFEAIFRGVGPELHKRNKAREPIIWGKLGKHFSMSFCGIPLIS